MSNDQPATGPIPIYVRSIPAGTVLDLEAFTRLVVGDVLDALLDGQSTDLWDLLHEVADEKTTRVHAKFDREQLEQELTERASSRVPLYGTRAVELADQLMRAGRLRGVPGQQDRRAS
ncbi:hypothetical protein ACF09L_19025 [Streptomyces sp. NPDC014779]|uniref:hypothetical protein n=1 Tax=Streptomyces sp. NPDC014779 TaxID=3364911 RepID=UPI0036F82440